jgi:hypothetical protein
MIMMQAVEMSLACTLVCATKTVGEQLTKTPSRKALNALAAAKFIPEMIEFMQDIRGEGVSCIYSWPTIQSQLQCMTEDSLFLRGRLHPKPKEGGFVTENRFKAVLGSKHGGYKNAVKASHRVQKDVYEELLRLEPLLKRDSTDAAHYELVRGALAPLQGDNKSSYVHPTTIELAKGAATILQDKLRLPLPSNKTILLERWTYTAVKEYYPDMFTGCSIMDVIPKSALLLLRLRCGSRIIVTSSYFKAFAEETRRETRFNSIKE